MSQSDHTKLHSEKMLGKNNPVHKIRKDPKKWAHYIQAQSDAQSGDKNGKFSGYSHELVKLHAVKLTKKLGHKFSKTDWMSYAKNKGLPQAFSKWRKDELGKLSDLAIWAALECGLNNVEADPRLVKTLSSMEEQSYNAKISENRVLVEKECEECGKKFWIEHLKREQSICGNKCASLNLSKKDFWKLRQKSGASRFAKEKADKNRELQLLAYSNAKHRLGRQPKQKEWEDACKELSVPYRVGKALKYGFQRWVEVIAAGEEYNHRVVSVEYAGKETV